MGRKRRSQEPSRCLPGGPCTVQVYPWYGNPNTVLPYDMEKLIHRDPLEITQEFLSRGMGVCLRPAFFGENNTDLGCLIMVSEDRTFTMR